MDGARDVGQGEGGVVLCHHIHADDIDNSADNEWDAQSISQPNEFLELEHQANRNCY